MNIVKDMRVFNLVVGIIFLSYANSRDGLDGSIGFALGYATGMLITGLLLRAAGKPA
jgi:hypothetical protein